jgi:hypothetical protein
MSLLDDLLADAEDDRLAAASKAYRDARFDDAADRDAAVGWITANPQANALLLLLALRREAPDAYATIPAGARASVLAAALAERAALNDFGWIGERGAGHDREAGQALLELGDAAVPALRPLLDDRSEAPLDGSEEATLAEELGLRRADFAYRYLARIAGRDPEFDNDPAVRDEQIARLRAAL